MLTFSIEAINTEGAPCQSLVLLSYQSPWQAGRIAKPVICKGVLAEDSSVLIPSIEKVITRPVCDVTSAFSKRNYVQDPPQS